MARFSCAASTAVPLVYGNLAESPRQRRKGEEVREGKPHSSGLAEVEALEVLCFVKTSRKGRADKRIIRRDPKIVSGVLKRSLLIPRMVIGTRSRQFKHACRSRATMPRSREIRQAFVE